MIISDGEGPRPSAEWPAKVADAVEGVVGAVRSKAVRPLQSVARAIVFGVVVAVMGSVLAVLVAVGTVRVLNVYLFGSHEWASYLVVGGIFALAGMFVSSRKRARPSRADTRGE